MKKAISRCWIPLILLALALRLIALNVVPLGPAEAALALPAWQVQTGGEWPAATESPFLLNGTALLFALLPATDTVARLLPALCGTALILVPLLWRKRLGELGALVAGGLLTLSPIALFASRHLDGAIVGALGAALIISALLQDLGAGWLAAGLALGLTGGPAFFDTLLPALLAWLIVQRLESAYERPAASKVRRGTLMGVAGAALIAIAGGLHWSGLSGLGDGLMAWLRGWGTPVVPPANLALLLLYEPLTFLLASIELIPPHRKPSPPSLMLGVWALLAGMLLILRPGTAALSLLAALIPLALLAGRVAGRLVNQTQNERGFILLQAGLSLIFWLFAASILIRQISPNLRNGMEILLLVLVLIVQALMTAGFATLITPQAAKRGLLLGTAAMLFLVQLSFGWGVAYLRANDPREPLVGVAASKDLHNLQRIVDDLRQVRDDSPETFEIALVDDDPLITTTVHWALRDMPALRVAEGWPTTSPDLIITPHSYTVPEDNAKTLQGMPFLAIRRRGSATFPLCTQTFPPVCPDALAWYLHRDSPVPTQDSRILLWSSPTP